MLDRPDFESVAESDLLELIEAQVPEGMRIEYKRELYGDSDSDKKELLKDISSLANTSGGHLLIGVSENNGLPELLKPISNQNPDSDILRLEHIARSGIDPPIAGVHMRAISLSAGGYMIVCRVPKSWIGPHRVIAKGHNRFYLRNSAGVFEPSVNELRTMFTQSASALEQANAFRDQRISEVCAGDGLKPLQGNGRLFIHIVPTASLAGVVSLNLEDVSNKSRSFWPLGSDGFTPRFNYHGFIAERGGEENHGYVQIFRDGRLEATKASLIRERDHGRVVPGTGVEKLIFDSVPNYISGLVGLGIPSPHIILITLEGVLGVRYAISQEFEDGSGVPLPYDTLRLPEGFLEHDTSVVSVHKAMKPAFDALWNALGFSSSQYFDKNGMWTGGRGRI